MVSTINHHDGLQWIDAFLSNRSQRVALEGTFSEWKPVISGVAQGSVLGPILFILFIDDIAAVCSGNVRHQLFADDLKLYTGITSVDDMVSLQFSLDKLYHWCRLWQLDVNVSKCFVLTIGNNSTNQVIRLPELLFQMRIFVWSILA